MITKFLQYNESIKNLLVGPSDEELLKKYSDLSLIDLLWQSVHIGWLNGVKISVEKDDTLLKYVNYILEESCTKGNLDIVKYAIDNGADIHINRDMPLFNASYEGHYDIVKFLLENGADVYSSHYSITEEEEDNYTPYQISLTNKHYDVAKLIKSYMDKSTNESIKNLLVGPSEDEIIELFKDDPKRLLNYSTINNLQKGMEYAINHEDEIIESLKDDPDYLLEYSIDNNLQKGMEYAIKYGADVNKPGTIYLFKACNRGDYKLVILLIKNNINIDKHSLDIAKNNGYSDIVELLTNYKNKPTNESVQTELVIDVTDKDDIFINKLVESLSFVYKKRKDRHTRPIKITGRMIPHIDLNILLSNKDNIKIEYLDNEDLKIHVNNKLIYYDDVKQNEIISKVLNIYKKHLSTQKFKIKGGHPF